LKMTRPFHRLKNLGSIRQGRTTFFSRPFRGGCREIQRSRANLPAPDANEQFDRSAAIEILTAESPSPPCSKVGSRVVEVARDVPAGDRSAGAEGLIVVKAAVAAAVDLEILHNEGADGLH